MVLKNLNDDQKARRIEVSAEMLEQLETEPDFINRVITGAESWFFEYDLKPRGSMRNSTHHSFLDRKKLT
jgi:hypothetical protein